GYCFFILLNINLLFFFFVIRLILLFFFFFSSRRRHTRCSCDWSSDVCSSDLFVMQAPGGPEEDPTNGFTFGGWAMPFGRSEERRVGKECRSRGSPTHQKKK